MDAQAEAEAVLALEGLCRASAWVWTGRSRRLEHDDLCQVARLGALEAVRTYDPRRGTTLYTHAYRCIRYALLQYARENAGVVRVSHWGTEHGVKPPPVLSLDELAPDGRWQAPQLEDSWRERIHDRVFVRHLLRASRADDGTIDMLISTVGYGETYEAAGRRHGVSGPTAWERCRRAIERAAALVAG